MSVEDDEEEQKLQSVCDMYGQLRQKVFDEGELERLCDWFLVERRSTKAVPRESRSRSGATRSTCQVGVVFLDCNGYLTAVILCCITNE